MVREVRENITVFSFLCFWPSQNEIIEFMYTAKIRWAAARRIVELCPGAVGYLDRLMNLKPGKVFERASLENWNLQKAPDNADGVSPNNLAQTFVSLIGIARQEITEFERPQKSDGPSDGRIRSLATLVKTLQGLEEMQKRMEKAADDKVVDSEDILEIHRRLARKIKKVIQREKNN